MSVQEIAKGNNFTAGNIGKFDNYCVEYKFSCLFMIISNFVQKIQI